MKKINLFILFGLLTSGFIFLLSGALKFQNISGTSLVVLFLFYCISLVSGSIKIFSLLFKNDPNFWKTPYPLHLGISITITPVLYITDLFELYAVVIGLSASVISSAILVKKNYFGSKFIPVFLLLIIIPSFVVLLKENFIDICIVMYSGSSFLMIPTMLKFLGKKSNETT